MKRTRPANVLTTVLFTLLASLTVQAMPGQAVGDVQLRLSSLSTVSSTVWGVRKNRDGQLGDGTRMDRKTRVRAGSLIGVSSLAASTHRVMAVKRNGAVFGWGQNTGGTFGGRSSRHDGYPARYLTPHRINNLPDTSRAWFGNGDSTLFALAKDGTVWSWGYGGSGYLGRTIPGMSQGYEPYDWRPAQVRGLGRVVELSLPNGYGSAYARNAVGALYAWGDNHAGQLGDGTRKARWSPVRVQVPGVVRHVVGSRESAGAVTDDGRVWIWGSNGEAIVRTPKAFASVDTSQVRRLLTAGWEWNPDTLHYDRATVRYLGVDGHVHALTTGQDLVFDGPLLRGVEMAGSGSTSITTGYGTNGLTYWWTGTAWERLGVCPATAKNCVAGQNGDTARHVHWVLP